MTHLQTSRLIWLLNADKQRSESAKQSEQTKSLRYECGFFLVNQVHCVPEGLDKCVVCNKLTNGEKV